MPSQASKAGTSPHAFGDKSPTVLETRGSLALRSWLSLLRASRALLSSSTPSSTTMDPLMDPEHLAKRARLDAPPMDATAIAAAQAAIQQVAAAPHMGGAAEQLAVAEGMMQMPAQPATSTAAPATTEPAAAAATSGGAFNDVITHTAKDGRTYFSATLPGMANTANQGITIARHIVAPLAISQPGVSAPAGEVPKAAEAELPMAEASVATFEGQPVAAPMAFVSAPSPLPTPSPDACAPAAIRPSRRADSSTTRSPLPAHPPPHLTAATVTRPRRDRLAGHLVGRRRRRDERARLPPEPRGPDQLGHAGRPERRVRAPLWPRLPRHAARVPAAAAVGRRAGARRALRARRRGRLGAQAEGDEADAAEGAQGDQGAEAGEAAAAEGAQVGLPVLRAGAAAAAARGAPREGRRHRQAARRHLARRRPAVRAAPRTLRAQSPEQHATPDARAARRAATTPFAPAA